MAPLERAMVVSYRLSIVTVALSVTIRPQFAIECLRLNSTQLPVELSWVESSRVGRYDQAFSNQPEFRSSQISHYSLSVSVKNCQ